LNSHFAEVRAIHTKVRGRGRYHISGLSRADERVRKALETRLLEHQEITHASASPLTGNLLVHFHSDAGHEDIASLIVQTISQIKRPTGGRPAQETCGGSAEQNIHSTPDKKFREQGNKGKLRHLLPLPFKKQNVQPWHLLDKEGVLASVNTSEAAGISRQIAQRRLRRYGPNQLPESRSRSKWDLFAGQFNSLPVYLLAAAAGMSLLTGGVLDALIVMGVVVANGAIGYFTERKAEKTISSLKEIVRPSAAVIRDGRIVEIPCEEVVVGDLLVLKPGTYVAADARVLKSSHLSIDESVLTGESMPVYKNAKTLKRQQAPLADRFNMAYMGTLVTGGEGLAVVVATGRFSEIGRLQILLEETNPPQTPIQRQLTRMGDQLVLFCLSVCGAVFLMGFFRGYGFIQMLRMSISLAAAAVPEGLPAAATINFALGINRMRKHHVLIRHLQALETLGAVQTVCLDKTGTITRNQISVLKVHVGLNHVAVQNGGFALNGRSIEPLALEDFRQLIYSCALCNETKINGSGTEARSVLHGTPTENALVELALRAGVDVVELRSQYRRLKVNYRAENRLFMSTLHAGKDGRRVFTVKGSPPEVLKMCKYQSVDGKPTPLTEERRLDIETENQYLAAEALRVLGVAYMPLGADGDRDPENDLIWLGLVGMADPVREGVKEVLRIFHQAGVETVMITGDQSPTAYAVAQQLDLAEGNPIEILDSSELTSIEPEVMQALAGKVQVFSRVSPAHKLRIVQALQAAGKTVAMTGDGINDGPALKASDIGIAMGRSGTDVAREVADIVLKEDDLETLVVAVQDGRTTYKNIRKSVHFFLSTNFSEIMVMGAAMAMGVGAPLNVMQLLWINIISDIFPGLALSMEEPEPDVLAQAPREPNAPLFSSADFRQMTYESAFMSAGAMSAYGFGIARYGMGARAGSLAFQSLTIGQLLHAISCRSEKHNMFDREKRPSNKYLSTALVGSLALQALTFYIPWLRRLLGLSPLSLLDAAVIGGSSVFPLVVNEARKKKPEGDSNEK
jgi:Ca2+-transporting ATPase